jgi:hypothetical protein
VYQRKGGQRECIKCAKERVRISRARANLRVEL